MASVRKNLSGSVYLALANAGGQAALVPVYLNFWGQQRFGEWLVIFAIPAVFVVSEAGLSHSIGNAVTLATNRGDAKTAEKTINAAWKLQALGWALTCVVLFGFSAVQPLQPLLGLEGMTSAEFCHTVVLLSLYTLLFMQSGILGSLYRAAGKYERFLLISGHAKVVETATIAGLLSMGGQFRSVAVGLLACRTFVTVFLVRNSMQMVPGVRLNLKAGRIRDLFPLIKSSLAFFSFPVAGALVNHGALVLVNRFVDAQAVVMLSVCRQLARLLQQWASVLQTSVQPEMTRAFAKGEPHRMVDLHGWALGAMLWVIPPYLAILGIWGNEIIRFWTGQTLTLPSFLVISCAVEAITFSLAMLCPLPAWSINRVGRISVVYGLASLVGGLGAAVTMPWLGVIAVPLGFSLGIGMYCGYGIFRSLAVSGGSLSEFLIILRHSLNLYTMVRKIKGGQS